MKQYMKLIHLRKNFTGMRITVLFFVLVLVGCSSSNEPKEITTDLVNNPNSASSEVTPAKMPEITFEENAYNFGDISQGEKVEHNFAFENTGESDLIITSAVGSCGCTVPSYPEEPIPPGGKGEIKIVFDSNGKKGAQHKRVTVVANTNPNKTMVAIMGNVLTPEN